MRPLRAIVLGLTVAASVMAHGPEARAEGACEADHLRAQEDRAHGRLLAARDAFLRCAASTCPGLVQTDCVKWLSEVDADLPTVVPSARTADGRELEKVTVELDGQPWVDSLDGKAVPVDPGSHTLRFLTEGLAPVEVEVIAKMGAKNEPAVATFAALEPAGRPKSAVIAAWTLVGIGGAAVVSFAGLTIAAQVQFQNLESTCSPHCPIADVEQVRAEFIAGDTLAVVGSVCLASALLIYFVVPPAKPAGNEPSAALLFRPTVGGGSAVVRVQF